LGKTRSRISQFREQEAIGKQHKKRRPQTMVHTRQRKITSANVFQTPAARHAHTSVESPTHFQQIEETGVPSDVAPMESMSTIEISPQDSKQPVQTAQNQPMILGIPAQHWERGKDDGMRIMGTGEQPIRLQRTEGTALTFTPQTTITTEVVPPLVTGRQGIPELRMSESSEDEGRKPVATAAPTAEVNIFDASSGGSHPQTPPTTQISNPMLTEMELLAHQLQHPKQDAQVQQTGQQPAPSRTYSLTPHVPLEVQQQLTKLTRALADKEFQIQQTNDDFHRQLAEMRDEIKHLRFNDEEKKKQIIFEKHRYDQGLHAEQQYSQGLLDKMNQQQFDFKLELDEAREQNMESSSGSSDDDDIAQPQQPTVPSDPALAQQTEPRQVGTTDLTDPLLSAMAETKDWNDIAEIWNPTPSKPATGRPSDATDPIQRPGIPGTFVFMKDGVRTERPIPQTGHAVRMSPDISHDEDEKDSTATPDDGAAGTTGGRAPDAPPVHPSGDVAGGHRSEQQGTGQATGSRPSVRTIPPRQDEPGQRARTRPQAPQMSGRPDPGDQSTSSHQVPSEQQRYQPPAEDAPLSERQWSDELPDMQGYPQGANPYAQVWQPQQGMYPGFQQPIYQYPGGVYGYPMYGNPGYPQPYGGAAQQQQYAQQGAQVPQQPLSPRQPLPPQQPQRPPREPRRPPQQPVQLQAPAQGANPYVRITDPRITSWLVAIITRNWRDEPYGELPQQKILETMWSSGLERPKKFTGQKRTWHSWFTTLENYGKALSANNTTIKNFMMNTLLPSEARETLGEQVTPLTKFSEVVRLLNTSYGGDDQSHVLWAEVSNFVQRKFGQDWQLPTDYYTIWNRRYKRLLREQTYSLAHGFRREHICIPDDMKVLRYFKQGSRGLLSRRLEKEENLTLVTLQRFVAAVHRKVQFSTKKMIEKDEMILHFKKTRITSFSQIWCDYCDIEGHVENECQNKIRDNWQPRRRGGRTGSERRFGRDVIEYRDTSPELGYQSSEPSTELRTSDKSRSQQNTVSKRLRTRVPGRGSPREEADPAEDREINPNSYTTAGIWRGRNPVATYCHNCKSFNHWVSKCIERPQDQIFSNEEE